MNDHRNLASLKVRDIEHLLVVEPAWVLETAAVEEVMEKMIADLRTRWVYVVDERKRLLGGVSMNAVVETLFPLEAIIERPDVPRRCPSCGRRGRRRVDAGTRQP